MIVMNIKTFIKNSWHKHKTLYKISFCLILMLIIVSIIFVGVKKDNSMITFLKYQDMAENGKIKKVSILPIQGMAFIETKDGEQFKLPFFQIDGVKVVKVSVDNKIKLEIVKT